MTNQTTAGSVGNRELWACAHQVLTQHGDRAPAFVAERISALALQGDAAGVATWKAIADRIDALQRPAISLQ